MEKFTKSQTYFCKKKHVKKRIFRIGKLQRARSKYVQYIYGNSGTRPQSLVPNLVNRARGVSMCFMCVWEKMCMVGNPYQEAFVAKWFSSPINPPRMALNFLRFAKVTFMQSNFITFARKQWIFLFLRGKEGCIIPEEMHDKFRCFLGFFFNLIYISTHR